MVEGFYEFQVSFLLGDPQDKNYNSLGEHKAASSGGHLPYKGTMLGMNV